MRSRGRLSLSSVSVTSPIQFATIPTSKRHSLTTRRHFCALCANESESNSGEWTGMKGIPFLLSLLEEPRNALTLRSKLVFLPRRTPTRRSWLTDWLLSYLQLVTTTSPGWHSRHILNVARREDMELKEVVLQLSNSMEFGWFEH